MDASEIIRKVKLGLIDSEGRVRVSEFYLTADDGEEIELCMPPEEIRVRSSASFRSYNVIEMGEIKFPKGEQLTNISWRGTLPGAGILLYPFVKHEAWDRPNEIIKVIRRWRERGTKLKLLITQTPVNLDVYIKGFDFTAKGGMGDYTYDIDLIAAKPLQVMTVAESDAARARESDNSFNLLTRAAMKSRTGILVGQLNTAWTVAQVLTGNGGNWQALLDQNGINTPDLLDLTTWIMN
ncbi:MAG: hypothetical protein IKE46_11955 [Selenomonadaceae bacterium]|nr:hypothetical protein [Selenomonadaceae bacterium]